MKNIIKQFMPPVLLSILKYLFRKQEVTWNGDYESWSAALKKCGGYDAANILDTVKEAALKVKRGEFAYERDGVTFSEPEYNWPLIATILKAAAENNGKVNVLDFGGALGSSYYQERKILDNIDLKWIVVEQPNYVDCGKKYFQDDVLEFSNSVGEVLKENKIDVFLLSNVLPYLESPYEIFDEVVKAKVKYVIIDRTPVCLTADKDRLTVQNVPASIYKASYPAWIFSESKLLNKITGINYECIADFYPFEGEFYINKPYCEFVFKGYIFSMIENIK